MTPADQPEADVRSPEPWQPGRVIVNASTYKERENIGGLIEIGRAHV